MSDYPKPKANFPYTMKTTAIMEHSRGVSWTANLLRDGKVVGTVEQMGDGGPDRVDLSDREQQHAWNLIVAVAFAGNEEEATFYLLCDEEES